MQMQTVLRDIDESPSMFVYAVINDGKQEELSLPLRKFLEECGFVRLREQDKPASLAKEVWFLPSMSAVKGPLLEQIKKSDKTSDIDKAILIQKFLRGQHNVPDLHTAEHIPGIVYVV